MLVHDNQIAFAVHCRIGSLEIFGCKFVASSFVHCRIGSLEMMTLSPRVEEPVHCRIGSLERL